MTDIVTRLRERGDELSVEAAGLLERLPRYADTNQIILPGDEVWAYFKSHRTGRYSYSMAWADYYDSDEPRIPGDDDCPTEDGSGWYSSREAVRAAIAKAEGGDE